MATYRLITINNRGGRYPHNTERYSNLRAAKEARDNANNLRREPNVHLQTLNNGTWEDYE